MEKFSIGDVSKLSSPQERRKAVLEPMKEQFAQGMNCANCIGHCCTSLYNSMQVTPLEAIDLYIYLKNENRINEDLVTKLKDCVKTFRLDYVISTGRNSSFRRSYTCPFYEPGAKGCSIDPQYKPYGCLAFNPLKVGVSESGSCTSYIKLLENRESQSEDEINEKLQGQLGLPWQKESLPIALLKLIELFE